MRWTKCSIMPGSSALNAVIGLRYDATEVMQGVTEVLCYGTAVLVEPQQT